MNSKLNWRDEWSQTEIASKTNTFVDYILDKIYQNKFNFHTKHDLNNFEVTNPFLQDFQ